MFSNNPSNQKLNRFNNTLGGIDGLNNNKPDLIIIDRSINPENNKIAVCFLDGEFTVKRINKKGEKLYLKPENKKYKPIKIDEENELQIWGIVTYVIKSL